MSRRVPPHAAGDHKRLDTVLAAGLAHTRLTDTNPPPAPNQSPQTFRHPLTDLTDLTDPTDAKRKPEGDASEGDASEGSKVARFSVLPDDVLLQILSVPQDCDSLLTMCSDIPEFSSICADGNHDFWKAVLQRKGWMVDWPKNASGDVEEPGGLSPKRFYLMLCQMTDEQVRRLTALTSTTTSIPDFWMIYNVHLAITALPPSITDIGKFAFIGCTSLALRSLPPNLKLIKDNAFESCRSLVLNAPEAIPSSTTDIGKYAFRECTSLALQALPPELRNIPEWAFYRCTSLALETLPPNIVSIKFSAFGLCTSLALRTLPPKLDSIGAAAFGGCKLLALQELPPNITSIETNAFHECWSLALGDFTELGSSLEIEEFAFSGLDYLEETPFGDAVKVKESSAFAPTTG
jgi:hypothetical protein